MLYQRTLADMLTKVSKGVSMRTPGDMGPLLPPGPAITTTGAHTVSPKNPLWPLLRFEETDFLRNLLCVHSFYVTCEPNIEELISESLQLNNTKSCYFQPSVPTST